ncbi:YadA C-terminal domain-containing protein [Moraxella marmotae]|uniref:YadA C-terminal domain-containing protein n=1 Tax=Moraxella marmotae TaxID=3344520 RepID=UPI0035F26BEB
MKKPTLDASALIALKDNKDLNVKVGDIVLDPKTNIAKPKVSAVPAETLSYSLPSVVPSKDGKNLYALGEATTVGVHDGKPVVETSGTSDPSLKTPTADKPTLNISAYENSISRLVDDAHTADIEANKEMIDAIDKLHADAILANRADIDANKEMIDAIDKLHADAILANRADIDANKEAIDANKTVIDANTLLITANSIATNANTKGVADNAAAITANKAGIEANLINITANSIATNKNTAGVAANKEAIETNKATADTAIAANKAAIEANKAAADQAVATANTAIAANKADIEANKTSITTLADTVEANKVAANTAIDANKADIAALTQTVAANRTTDNQATNNAIASANAKINQNAQDIKELDEQMKRGLATQAALTGLFQPYQVGKANLTLAVGGYKSESALAIGTGYRFNEKVATKAGVAFGTSGNSAAYNLGVNFEW